MTEFQKSYTRGLRFLAVAITLIVAALITSVNIDHETVGKAAPDQIPFMVTRPDVPHGPMAVLKDHADCWTGAQPKDVKYPGGVIWQNPDGRAFYTMNDQFVDRALDTVFGDGDLTGNPVAFCR